MHVFNKKKIEDHMPSQILKSCYHKLNTNSWKKNIFLWRLVEKSRFGFINPKNLF